MKTNDRASVASVAFLITTLTVATCLPTSAYAADESDPIAAQIAKLQSANVTERSEALMRLRQPGAAEAIPALIQMLGSEMEFPRMRLLISSTRPITGSCSPECTFGGEAAETLARIGILSDRLLAALKSADWRTRANAARALGGLKDGRATTDLIALLSRPDEPWQVKGNAALALGLLADDRATELLVAALKDKNARVRAAAAMALGHLQAPASLQPLIAALKDADYEVRRSVAGTLGGFNNAATVEPLIQALHDEERTVREVTARALGRTRDPRAVSALLAALNDEYVNVQMNAAEALAQLRSSEAVDPLIKMLSSKEPGARDAAATALGDLGADRAREPLLALVHREGSSTMPSLRGLQALVKLGHPGAAEALKEYNQHRPGWNEWWSQNKERLIGP